MKVATVWIDPETRLIAVKFPFDKQIVELVNPKDSAGHKIDGFFPAALRRFDYSRKLWLFDQSLMDKVEEFLTIHKFQVTDGTLAEERQGSNDGSAYTELLAPLPDELLKRVYRLLATECHPDKGGSHEVMTKINQAWARIKQERGF
jgi:hypothetical protein